MNLFSRFTNLTRKPQRYYGEIVAKNGLALTVTVLGGGQFSVFLNTDLVEGETVWLNYDGSRWTIESAPEMTEEGPIEI
jgi:riboflavin synthase alpha subunit